MIWCNFFVMHIFNELQLSFSENISVTAPPSMTGPGVPTFADSWVAFCLQKITDHLPLHSTYCTTCGENNGQFHCQLFYRYITRPIKLSKSVAATYEDYYFTFQNFSVHIWTNTVLQPYSYPLKQVAQWPRLQLNQQSCWFPNSDYRTAGCMTCIVRRISVV